MAGWSEGKELSELKDSLNTIRTAASELITAIDEKAQELINEKEETREIREEKLNGAEEKEAKKPSIRKRLKEERATETQRKVRASKTKHKEEVR